MLSDKVLKAILEYLNLEENEEFGIEDSNYMRRINKKGIQVYITGSDGWRSSTYLNELLLGKVKMIKLPFVPELNEAYYVPDISIVDLYFKTLNYNTKDDKHRIEREICFRTKEGAINRTIEVLGSLRGGADE